MDVAVCVSVCVRVGAATREMVVLKRGLYYWYSSTAHVHVRACVRTLLRSGKRQNAPTKHRLFGGWTECNNEPHRRCCCNCINVDWSSASLALVHLPIPLPSFPVALSPPTFSPTHSLTHHSSCKSSLPLGRAECPDERDGWNLTNKTSARIITRIVTTVGRTFVSCRFGIGIGVGCFPTQSIKRANHHIHFRLCVSFFPSDRPMAAHRTRTTPKRTIHALCNCPKKFPSLHNSNMHT